MSVLYTTDEAYHCAICGDPINGMEFIGVYRLGRLEDADEPSAIARFHIGGCASVASEEGWTTERVVEEGSLGGERP